MPVSYTHRRELKNVIEGCFNSVNDGFLTKEDIPSYLLSSIQFYQNAPADDESLSLDQRVKRFEKEIIVNTLKRHRTLSNTCLLYTSNMQIF